MIHVLSFPLFPTLIVIAGLAVAPAVGQQGTAEAPSAASEMTPAEAPLIALDEVRDHVGKRASVEFVVASSYFMEAKKICFLNSEKNHRDEHNFTVIIKGADLLDTFASHDVPEPAQHYYQKRIRVVGEITLHAERPQIELPDFKSLTVIQPPARAASASPTSP